MQTATELEIKRRVAWLFLFFSLFILLLAARMVQLQVVQNYSLTNLALKQRLWPVPVDAQRGMIYDRNMEKLAVSVSAAAVYATPVEVKDKPATARALASILHQPQDVLLQKLQQRVGTVWIKKQVSDAEAKGVRSLRLPGIGVVENPQRYYPNGELAASTLGIAGIDNQGLEGLEFYYDRYLRGVPGKVVAERDAKGVEIPGGIHRYLPARDGDSLVLTLDRVIQFIAERELRRAVLETRAARGLLLVMNPRTGEILALATYPSFDPNDYADYPPQNRRNFAVTDQYEPGSTFKVVTAAAALEAGVTTPDRRFFDPGFVTIDGVTMHCWLPGGHGSENFVEATENSCNPVFAQLGVELGPERFYQYIRAFGFGEPTGIDFPGEAAGMVNKPGSVPRVAWATTGFGQGISVTPLQLLNAVCTIANGGLVMRPHLAREIRTPDGKLVKEFPPEVIRRAISPQTAASMARILRSVVVNGSGARADIPGFRVAGKTGTAQVPEGGRYVPGKVIASFVGFAPFDDPKVAALVALYEPKSAITYGGVIAAPVFQAAVSDILEYLRVPPRFSAEELSKAGIGAQVAVPNALNLLTSEALDKLAAVGLRGQVVGSGSVVVDQTPRPGTQVREGTSVLLYTAAGGGADGVYPGETPPAPGEQGTQPYAAALGRVGAVSGNGDSTVVLPDLRGLGMRDAADALGRLGLRLRIVGSGLAVRQTPPPGSALPRGSTVTVTFGPPTP